MWGRASHDALGRLGNAVKTFWFVATNQERVHDHPVSLALRTIGAVQRQKNDGRSGKKNSFLVVAISIIAADESFPGTPSVST